jgi:hypothetical protein
MLDGFYQADFSVNNHIFMQYYIYQHRALDTGNIFYVGKGKDKRHSDKNKRGRYWKNYVAKHGFTSEIIKNEMDEELAFFAEMECIDVYKRRGIKLVNLSNGGEGCSGYSMNHSEEQKRKWSEMRKGTPSPRKGVKLSEETKEKLRIAKKGKPLSDKHCKAISKSLIGNKHTAKLTDDEVRFVRANKGIMTHIELSNKFGVHKNTIHKIWRGERYKGVI